jgi:phospholipase C
MKDEKDGSDAPSPESDNPTDTSRRRFLGGVAVLGAGATLGACSQHGDESGKSVERPLSPAEMDKALHDQVKTVVVIYAENRSFNNLFGDFPGVEKPLSALKPAEYQQRDRDDSLLQTLPPV